MIAELADGKKLKFADDTPDEAMDAIVMLHIQVAELTKAIGRMEEAYRAPRKIKVDYDFKDEKVIGATSIAVKTN